MRRLIISVFALAACAPWTVVQRAEPNPLASHPILAVQPLEWSEVLIDGLTEQGWNETNDEDMKKEWVIDRQISGDQFHNGFYAAASGKLQLVPGAAPLRIKTSVLNLKTGGIRPLFLTVRAQLLDGQGTVIEEITTEVKENRGRHAWGLFRSRLSNASREAGEIVAEYFAHRAQ